MIECSFCENPGNLEKFMRLPWLIFEGVSCTLSWISKFLVTGMTLKGLWMARGFLYYKL